MRAVVDTNVLVDYLRGSERARSELERYEDPAVSVVTWMEVLVGARGEDEIARTRSFLSRFSRLPVSDEVAERAAKLRRERGLRLPDAIIRATADAAGAILVTRDTRDFPPDDPGIRVPYDRP